jgi:allophanate hydrolase
VGTRSPYGAVGNAFRPEYVSGGSSSGSANVVARGLVPFSLGTDTAGSGRVPASFNNIVGLKPTRGWLSTAGVVPACRTLDCVSVFALTVEDAAEIASIAGAVDAVDPYSRAFPADAPVVLPSLRFAIPAQLEFFADLQAQAAFASALASMRALGAELVPIDFTPFRELAELLYQGPWVAERFVAVEALLQTNPQALQPVLRSILEGANRFSAADAFKAEYRRATLTVQIHAALAEFAALIVPSTPTIYSIAQIEADPVRLNSRFGTYTNFTNLADLCALALPAAMRADGLPAGITLISRAWEDRALAGFGKRWQRHIALPLGATGAAWPATDAAVSSRSPPASYVRLAVVGAHLTGMPLNHQLTSRRAIFVECARTAASYRLFALADTTPPKPGLVRGATGAPIEVELWDVPVSQFGSFVAEIPAPLGIGTLQLEDGRSVKGFICEPQGLEGGRDITQFGGWRAFLAAQQRR